MAHSQYGPDESDYALAFRSVRRARTVALLVILVALLVQIGGFVAVRWVGVIDAAVLTPKAESTTQPAPDVVIGPETKQPADQAEASDDDEFSEAPLASREEALGQAVFARHFLTWSMHAAKVVAPVMGAVLAVVLLVAVQLSLLGRLGGMAGQGGALLWSVLLVAILSPWQDILQDRLVSGATYTLSELIAASKLVLAGWGADNVPGAELIVYYARFLGIPVIALLFWLVVTLKFRRGLMEMALPAAVTEGQAAGDEPAAELEPPSTYGAEDPNLRV